MSMLAPARRSSRYETLNASRELINPCYVWRDVFLLLAHFGFLGFQRFLQRFIDPNSTEDENAGLDLNEPLYMQKLEEVV